MTEYAPVFANKPQTCEDRGGACDFVRISRYIETCKVCKCGRMSREWIAEMQARHGTR